MRPVSNNNIARAHIVPWQFIFAQRHHQTVTTPTAIESWSRPGSVPRAFWHLAKIDSPHPEPSERHADGKLSTHGASIAWWQCLVRSAGKSGTHLPTTSATGDVPTAMTTSSGGDPAPTCYLDGGSYLGENVLPRRVPVINCGSFFIQWRPDDPPSCTFRPVGIRSVKPSRLSAIPTDRNRSKG